MVERMFCRLCHFWEYRRNLYGEKHDNRNRNAENAGIYTGTNRPCRTHGNSNSSGRKRTDFEYANLVGEEEKVRTLVRNLADAVNRSDEDRVEELLDDAQMDIQDLPDPTIGKLELRDYGYTAEDMVPLRKAAALDYHRMGSKIYCLGSDGSKGEYASKEMIQAHEGLFGMESQMWERIRDQDLDYADEDFGAFQEPMNVIGQEEALKLYDAGADIYLITNFHHQSMLQSEWRLNEVRSIIRCLQKNWNDSAIWNGRCRNIRRFSL